MNPFWCLVAYAFGAVSGALVVRQRRRRPPNILARPDRTCERIGPRGLPHG